MRTGRRAHPTFPSEVAGRGCHCCAHAQILDSRPLATTTALKRAEDDYFDWLDHVWPAAGCAHPSGNRRTSACPSCAETYRRDAYQLIRSGLIGSKTVPASVANHPAVFATFTAPSFGPVHARHIRRHACIDKTRCACRPRWHRP